MKQAAAEQAARQAEEAARQQAAAEQAARQAEEAARRQAAAEQAARPAEEAARQQAAAEQAARPAQAAIAIVLKLKPRDLKRLVKCFGGATWPYDYTDKELDDLGSDYLEMQREIRRGK